MSACRHLMCPRLKTSNLCDNISPSLPEIRVGNDINPVIAVGCAITYPQIQLEKK